MRVQNLLLIFIVSLFLISCSQNSTNLIDDEDTIVFIIKSSPRTLDPRYATDATSFRIAQLLYKAPIKFNEQSQPIPWLTTWVTTDNLSYHLTIKNNEFFSNGDPVTSSDLISTYKTVLDKSYASPHKEGLKNIKSIKKAKNHSSKNIIITLKNKDPLFMSQMVIGVLHHKLNSAKVLKQQLSNSSFELLSWDGEGDLVLKRKKDDLNILFRISKDPTVQIIQMLKGEADIIQGGLSPELVNYLHQQDSILIKEKKGSSYTYLGLNMSDSVLKNIKVREAIALAIDREAIIKYLFNNRAELAESLLPPKHWFSNKDLPIIKKNIIEAKKILESLGYNKLNPLKLSYKTSKSNFRLRIATLIQSQLEKANFQITIQSYDWGTFYNDIKQGNFQIYSLSWIGIKNPNIYEYVFHSKMQPPKGANRGKYTNKTVDSLLDNIGNETTINKKQEYYYKLQKIIAKDLPYISLWYENQYVVLSERTRSYQLAADGNYLSLEQLRIN